ncbi:murein DD-endopeptidase MepM/ murein hydrolase activator NlpD [Trueperella bonasi]|uniref:Murein DD-endopeptidase MepM/ murein hydrolase activator NlpD n=1 Tax=Trueperella bonasi TaxID=312286 RepID=A0ABT9NEE5_9ACTO|nr:M23 family metallopeptidase [Trueperella bonasi]MDP9805759.1 murein DD-endopeptidase MepM/ murein hydrolase activator NlpD [Trueperella bonasi]
MRKIFTFISVFAIAVSGAAIVLPAAADERSDLVDQQEEQEREIERLQSELEGIDVDLQDAYLQLEETRGKIPGAEADVIQADNELAAAIREAEANAALLEAAQGELERIQNEIAQHEANAEQTRKSLGEYARVTYRGDTMPSELEVLIGASSAEDFANAYRAHTAVSRSQASSLTEYEQQAAQSKNRESRQSAVEEEIEKLKRASDELVVVQKEKKQLADQKRDELLELEDQFAEQSEGLEARKDDYINSIDNLEVARDKTAQRIVEIDEENRRKEAERIAAEKAAAEKAARDQAARNHQPAPAPAAPQQTSSSWIQPPVPAPVYVTSPFGMRQYPFGGMWMHNGVDLRSRCGEAQTAAADGVVSAVVPAAGNGTHGNQVFINHGIVGGSSYVTVTNHLQAFNVTTGQSVKQGQVIGWTGETGLVTACHVHFEVWKDGTVIDPMTFSSFVRRWS